jgi:hypothetical protein
MLTALLKLHLPSHRTVLSRSLAGILGVGGEDVYNNNSATETVASRYYTNPTVVSCARMSWKSVRAAQHDFRAHRLPSAESEREEKSEQDNVS